MKHSKGLICVCSILFITTSKETTVLFRYIVEYRLDKAIKVWSYKESNVDRHTF